MLLTMRTSNSVNKRYIHIKELLKTRSRKESEQIINSTDLMVVGSTITVVELPFHDRSLKGDLAYCARTLGVASLVFARSDDRKMSHAILILSRYQRKFLVDSSPFSKIFLS